MGTALRRLEQAPHLVDLGASVAAFLETEGAQRRVAEDAVAAHLADLLETELPAEPDRLFEAERMWAPTRLFEQLAIDRHPASRATSRAGSAQCLVAQYAAPGHSRSKTVAMPCPNPMHMVARPKRPCRRRSSWRSVAVRRAPLHPSGCPSATAPPFTLSFSSEMLSS